jgi:hypothetical protein
VSQPNYIFGMLIWMGSGQFFFCYFFTLFIVILFIHIIKLIKFIKLN